MALGAGLTIEVRTGGADTQGAGFLFGAAGADFSQQNSKNTTQQGTGTTLSAAITSTSATSCSVTTIANLYGTQQALLANPLVGDWIKIDSEIMKVTAVSGSTLTIMRGQLGTSAATHLISATVTNISNVSTTDLATAGTTTITSATAYFSANAVGNIIYIQGGSVPITAGWYQITAVGTSGANTTATVDRSTGLTTGTGATMNIGGALATPGVASAISVNYSTTFVQNGTYSISSNTTNIAGGALAPAGSSTMIGYSTNRFFGNTDTPPVIQHTASTITTIQSAATFVNMTFNGNSQTAAKFSSSGTAYLYCTIENYNTAVSAGQPVLISCTITGNSAVIAPTAVAVAYYYCEIYANTVTMVANPAVGCISYNNTGATTDGFGSGVGYFIDCFSVNNGRNGFYCNGAGAFYVNCHSESNAAYGYNNALSRAMWVMNCSACLNGTAATNGFTSNVSLFTTLLAPSGTVFVSASANNYALNNIVGQGALLRAAGFCGYAKNFPRGLTTSYPDVGAAQHQDSPPMINQIINRYVVNEGDF